MINFLLGRCLSKREYFVVVAFVLHGILFYFKNQRRILIMMNTVILIGRLAKDVELKYTPNGTAVANTTIACERPKQEGKEKTTDFINCVIWGKTAENAANYLSKGRLVAIEGAIHTRNYEDKSGKKVYVTEVNVTNVKYLDSGTKESSPSSASVNPFAQATVSYQPATNVFSAPVGSGASPLSFSEELPF